MSVYLIGYVVSVYLIGYVVSVYLVGYVVSAYLIGYVVSGNEGTKHGFILHQTMDVGSSVVLASRTRAFRLNGLEIFRKFHSA